MSEKCRECDEAGVKHGWTNSLYCSEDCERAGVSKLHASMLGAGRSPYRGWVPSHIDREIKQRWEIDQ